MSENDKALAEISADKSGKITFANDVIATIAGLAASETEGLSGMSGGIVKGFAEKLGRKDLTKGVKVEVGQSEAAIDVFVIIEYGYKIQDVAVDIQRKVKNAVETMTGLKIVQVNVFVQGISFEKQAKIAVTAEE